MQDFEVHDVTVRLFCGARGSFWCVSSIVPYILRKLPPWRPKTLPQTVTYVVRGVRRDVLEDVLNYLSCNASKLPYAEQTTLEPRGFVATQTNLAAIAAFMFTVLISYLLLRILLIGQIFSIIHWLGSPSWSNSRLTLQHGFLKLFISVFWKWCLSVARTRLFRLPQEAEWGYAGYCKEHNEAYKRHCKKQKEAIKDNARSRMRLCRIPQEAEWGYKGHCKKQNEAMKATARKWTRQ